MTFELVRKTFIKDFCISTVLLDNHGSYKTNNKKLGCELCKYGIKHNHGLYETRIFNTKNNKIVEHDIDPLNNYYNRHETKEESIEVHEGMVRLYEDKIYLKVFHSGENI